MSRHFLFPSDKRHCDNTRIAMATQEKSSQLKTAYRKCSVTSVYRNARTIVDRGPEG